MNSKSPFWVVVVVEAVAVEAVVVVVEAVVEAVVVVVETDGLFLEVKTNLVMFQLTDPNPGVVCPTLPHQVFLTLLFQPSDFGADCCC